MGVFEKIKNALFEVEYVEVDEPPKKEKKAKIKGIRSFYFTYTGNRKYNNS